MADGEAFPDVADLLRSAARRGSLRSLLGRLVLELDARLNAQLSTILEAPRFQQLEAAWRGVLEVVQAATDAPEVRIKVFDQSWRSLSRDLHGNLDGRRTLLYRNVVMKELDTPGGAPFGILYIEHALALSVEEEFDDFYTAQLLCDLGASAACPVLLTVAPDFFGESDAAWLSHGKRMRGVLRGEEYRPWHELRAHPNARFLAVVWPSVLLRGRYEDCSAGFPFHQWPSQSRGLWGHGGIAFLRSVIAEYRRVAWFGFLKMIGERPGEGAVLDDSLAPLPLAVIRPSVARLRLTRGLGEELSQLGFIPLCESLKSHALYFVGNRSVVACQGKPGCEVLTQIQSVLLGCRMVHYLRVLIRGLIGQIQSAVECERIINNWLEPFCATVDQASPEILARYPLRAATATVRASGGGSARFTCLVTLCPQYQIDGLLGEITLATDLPVVNRGVNE